MVRTIVKALRQLLSATRLEGLHVRQFTIDLQMPHVGQRKHTTRDTERGLVLCQASQAHLCGKLETQVPSHGFQEPLPACG